MKQEKLSGFKFLKCLILIAGAIAAGVLIATKTTVFPHDGNIFLNALLLFLGLFIILIFGLLFNSILATLVSTLFGKLTGYKLVFFKLGTKKYVYEDGKLVKKVFPVNSQVCLSVMEPPEMKDGKFPYKLRLLGENIVYILFTIINTVLFFVLKDIVQYVAVCFLGLALGALIQADFNIIPNMSYLAYNNAYTVLKMAKNEKIKQLVYDTIKANCAMAKNISLKDLDSKYIYLPEMDELDSPIATGMAFLYYQQLKANNRYDEALSIGKLLLNSNKVSMIGIHRLLLLSDQIYDNCLKGDYGTASVFNNDFIFERYSKALNNIPQIIRARYAYEVFVNNSYEKANKLKILFYKAYSNYPIMSEVEGEVELFERIDKVYKEKNGISEN